VRAVDPAGFKAALGAANRLNSWANVVTELGAELILTAIFVFIVFAAVDQTRGAHSAHVPALAPLAIGIVVFLAHIVAVPIDGCSVNPARSFGAAVVDARGSTTGSFRWGLLWVVLLQGCCMRPWHTGHRCLVGLLRSRIASLVLALLDPRSTQHKICYWHAAFPMSP
jgi:hypothetical protein